MISLSVNLRAQLRWVDVTSDFGKLPSNLKVYRTTDSLAGRPFIGYCVIVPLKNKKVEFTTQVGNGKRFKPTEYYLSEDSPLVIINGTFFSFQTNQNLNTVIRNGEIVAYNVTAVKSQNSDSFYYATRGAIGIKRNRKADVAWLFTDSLQRWPYAFQDRPIVAKGKNPKPTINDLNTLDSWTRWRMNTAIGGGPVLVKDQTLMVTNKEEQMFVNGDKDKHPRTAMGYTSDGKLVLLAIQGRFPGIAEGATLEEEGNILLDLGCVEALNLDGGGSSCLLINGKETIKPSDKEGQRAVPAVFIIHSKKKNKKRFPGNS